MNSNLKFGSCLLAGLALSGAVAVAQAGVVYNNLAAVPSGSDPVFSFGPLANSFTTDADGGRLAGVSLMLRNFNDQVVGNLSVSLLADSGVAPGRTLVSLGSLSSAAVSTAAFGVYDFGPLATTLLAASTTYWIGLSADDPVAVEWSWSTDLLPLGVAGQSSYSAALGVQANSAAGAYQMAVSVPEPASLALVALSLALMAGLTRRSRR